MWRPWDTDSKQVQEHQYHENESSDEIPMLAGDSEDSVIFIVEKPSPSIQVPHIITRASQALTTFSSSCSDRSSSLGKYFIRILQLVGQMSKTYIFSGVYRNRNCINCNNFCCSVESSSYSRNSTQM